MVCVCVSCVDLVNKMDSHPAGGYTEVTEAGARRI